MPGKKIKKQNVGKTKETIEIEVPSVKPGPPLAAVVPATSGVRPISLLRAVLVAVLLAVVSQAVHIAESLLTMNYYLDPTYFAIWSKVMMPVAGPPPAEFFYLSTAFALVTGFIYVWAYKTIEPQIEQNDGWMKKGLHFGVLLFLIGGLPSLFILYLMVNLPLTLLLWWTASGLLIALIDGLLLAKLC
ncbi:MAG: hypothetical protein V1492_02935 [Candidatus Micrarchaeota archaeon]